MNPARAARGTGCTRISICCNRFLPISTNGDLVYLVAPRCEGQCRQVPVLMARIQAALGRNLDKLELVQLTPPHEANSEMREGDILLVDARGLAILRYEVPGSTTTWPLLGKAVLSDLQQLLKYQRGVQ